MIGGYKNMLKTHGSARLNLVAIAQNVKKTSEIAHFGVILILVPKEAPVESENIRNGLAMPKNPYFDPSHISELSLGAKR